MKPDSFEKNSWRSLVPGALMAYQPKARKRIHAVRRAPDGSAFQKCHYCGVLIAVALEDMHDCKSKTNGKRFKGEHDIQSTQKQSFHNQPRSPFCFFIEGFMKTNSCEDWINVDRRGFETWQKMSKEEKETYVLQAEKVNWAYEEALLEEIEQKSEVDDEADSRMVGKVDPVRQYYDAYDDSENFDSFDSLYS